jgi:hypothetical protein
VFCEIDPKIFVWGPALTYLVAGCMSVYLSYYLLKRVLKLEQKSFHFIMWVVL